jgi:polysaccharide pyruvyl transferase WcaK-like protein
MMKELARRLLPGAAWEHLKSRRASHSARGLFSQWQALTTGLTLLPRDKTTTRILLIPSDPRWIVGSCGDEAMITATVGMLDQVVPGAAIDIIVEGAAAVEIAKGLGFGPHNIWSSEDYPSAVARLMQENRYRAIICVGADIIDGFYGISVPSKMLASMDIAARLGVKASMLGASFSATPDARLQPFFNKLHPDVRLCIRDEISLSRFEAFCAARAELVADSAFMLPSADPGTETLQWIEAQRNAGKRVIGVNLHPMLLHRGEEAQARLINPAVDVLTSVADARSVAFMLIPHDRRADCGDASVLEPIREKLAERMNDSVRMFGGRPHASELKGLAGSVDGVLTGRMHLAIASIGQGTPILCVTYQDKFEGLLRHVQQPDENLMSVDQLNLREVAVPRIVNFIDRLSSSRSAVAEQLPRVFELSRRNFDFLN